MSDIMLELSVLLFILIPFGMLIWFAFNLIRFLLTKKDNAEVRKTRKTMLITSLIATVCVIVLEIIIAVIFANIAVTHM